MLRKEEERLCKKYGASTIKEVLKIQEDIISQYYRKKTLSINDYY